MFRPNIISFNIITMSKAEEKPDIINIQADIEWIRQNKDNQQLNNQELQEENKKILQTLKTIETRLDKELEYQKKNINLKEVATTQNNQEKIINQAIKNNDTLIKVLEKEVKKLRERREELKNGYESKLNAKKYELEKKFNELKSEVRKMKLEEKSLSKKLSNHHNEYQPQSLTENMKLQEELRVYSIKYMKQLQKYNKVTEQLAIASNASQPELVVPEQFYDQELQAREQAQYKQYQGIVKLCTILSKRNDSENNKFNRIYNQKLKELEKTIVNLGQIDRMIALKEGEIIEGKKNVELVKFKINNNQKIDDPFLSLSQSSLRKNSYSLSKLPSYLQKKDKDSNDPIMRKLSKRN